MKLEHIATPLLNSIIIGFTLAVTADASYAFKKLDKIEEYRNRERFEEALIEINKFKAYGPTSHSIKRDILPKIKAELKYLSY